MGKLYNTMGQQIGEFASPDRLILQGAVIPPGFKCFPYATRPTADYFIPNSSVGGTTDEKGIVRGGNRLSPGEQVGKIQKFDRATPPPGLKMPGPTDDSSSFFAAYDHDNRLIGYAGQPEAWVAATALVAAAMLGMRRF
jgi:hypothetical protein